jgi:hypothetical protein
MVFKFLCGLLFLIVSAFNCDATTVHVLHDEGSKVRLQDPSYANTLFFAPKFEYPGKTIFELKGKDINFYSLSISSEEYYFWFEKSSGNIEIDLSGSGSSNFILIAKSNWHLGKLESNSTSLNQLNEFDMLYKNALDSLMYLADNEEKFRAEKDFSTVVWDSRSAKRLYNLAVEKFTYQVDEKWVHFAPAYTHYWQLMYKLYYQYFHTNAFKGLKKYEIKSQIEEDFNYPESKLLVFHHFFREGLNSIDLKENYELLEDELDERETNLAEAFIQNQAVKELSYTRKIDFLFGIDIDGAMEGYFARDSSEKKNVLVFWSIWDSKMKTEFNLLVDLKRDYEEHYSFIHICIDAYETPERTKSLIYQNKVGGFHLLPEQANAFRKSNLRRDLKIRDFPFYVITDNSGKVIETEHIPLEVSKRLTNKIKEVSTKK